MTTVRELPGRRAGRTGSAGTPFDRPRAFLTRHRSITIIFGMALVTAVLPLIVLLPPLNGFQTQRVWIDAFADAGIFVLLALGLNVVVGLAGLLDLGYAAFFAIGAYVYAYSSSSFVGLAHPVLADALRRCRSSPPCSASCSGHRRCAFAATTSRSSRSGFGEIVPVVFTNADTFTNGTNGISGIDRPSLPGVEFAVRRTPCRTT